MKCPIFKSLPAESECLKRRREDRTLGRSSACGRCGRKIEIPKEIKRHGRGVFSPVSLKVGTSYIKPDPTPCLQKKSKRGDGVVNRPGSPVIAGSNPAPSSKNRPKLPGAQGEGKSTKEGRATGKDAPHSVRYMSFAGSPVKKEEKPVAVILTHADYGRMGAAVRWANKVKPRKGWRAA